MLDRNDFELILIRNYSDIRIRYGNPPVYITKIGWSDDGRLDDFERIEVYRGYFKQMLLSIYEDECNLVGVSSM